MRERRKAKRAARLILVLCIAYIAYFLISMIIPPLFHPSVPQSEMSTHEKNHVTSERILCIDDNTDALLWRLRLIEEAKDEIIISTFEWYTDESGTDIISALINASERGVNVRIVIDGICGFLKLRGEPAFEALAGTPGIEVRFYNPVNLLLPWKLNYRLHDKYFIADDAMYILGGRNVNDLFLGDYPGRKNIDRDILVCSNTMTEQSSVYSLRQYFEELWDSGICMTYKAKSGKKATQAAEAMKERYESLRTAYPAAYTETDWFAATMPVDGISLITNPINVGNKVPLLWASVIDFMEEGSDIDIQTPYIILNRESLGTLSALCNDGRNISLITNAPETGANPWGCSDFLNNKARIVATGMDVYTYSGDKSLHSKAITIDDNLCVIGSFNFDMRSLYLDTEMMLVIDSPNLNKALRDIAESQKEYSALLLPSGKEEPGPYFAKPSMPFGKKIIFPIMRLMIPAIRQIL